MVSAREFCRQATYPVAIFLTYSFDPLFFERVPLADLKIGGSRRILVAADAGEVTKVMHRDIGQIVHLGRQYTVAEATGVGTFHPKLIARLSNSGGRIWVGSGNLTFTGWGGNCELATSWAVGPSEEDDGSWLNGMLGSVSEVVKSTTFTDQLLEIRREIPWLAADSATSPKRFALIGMPAHPLATQLAARWTGRRFDELHLCTGSSDIDGAFLNWAHRTFGIKRAILYLSPAYASFDPTRLARLPFEIRIIAASPNKRLHAKFYWFSGPDGDAAIVGSANCSAAAWLAGNVELVVIYDDAKAADFDSVLTVFRGPTLSPSEALSDRPPSPEPSLQDTASHRLVSLRIRSNRLIEALIEPQLSGASQLDIVIDSKPAALTIKLRAQGDKHVGVLPKEFQPGAMTLFGRAEGISGGVPFKTDPRWIDNDALLEQAARSPTKDKSLEDFSRGSLAGMDHQRILEAIQSVAARLLKHPTPQDNASAQPPRPASNATPTPNVPHAAPPVDPAALIRSINDLRRGSSTALGRHSIGYGGALRGVIAMLFHEDESHEIDLAQETWTAMEPEKADPETDLAPPPPPPPPPPPRSDASADRESRAIFRREIDEFLHELANPQFAAKCDPTQLVEALAFPLLVCIRGSEGGWLPSTELAAVATRVATIMFHEAYERGKPNGLIAFVRDRHQALNQLDEFRNTLGDGTLWITLLAALRIEPSTDHRTLLPQASAIGDVFQSRELLASSDAVWLSGLIGKLLIQNAESQITENAENIAKANDRLFAALLNHWESLDRTQGGGRQLRPASMLLWSQQWGWLVTPRTPANGYHPGYIDFEAAASRYPSIAEALKLLLESCGRQPDVTLGQRLLPQLT